MYLLDVLLERLGLRLPPGKRNFALDERLLEPLETLAEEEERSADDLANELLRQAVNQIGFNRDTWRRWSELTSREQQVTALICLGYAYYQIAWRLGITENTVKTHTKNIFSKFDLHGRGELQVLMRDWDFRGWE
ncbi:MAG: hypothetical protein JXB15_12240 [Anaerolineales bacterium]|nr:hypothetical protein [Anaerolineales bacterium]